MHAPSPISLLLFRKLAPQYDTSRDQESHQEEVTPDSEKVPQQGPKEKLVGEDDCHYFLPSTSPDETVSMSGRHSAHKWQRKGGVSDPDLWCFRTHIG